MAGARMNRPERLAAYLSLAARTPFDWPSFNCTVGFASNWVAQERGVDPGALWRGACTTPLAAARLMRRHGGLIAMVTREATACGLETTADPQLGDIAVVQLQGVRRRVLSMALRTARRWAFLSPNGLSMGAAVPVQSWRV